MNKRFLLIGALIASGFGLQAQETTTQIEEVTLTSKFPQELTKVGKNVTLLTQKDLQKFQGQDLSEVLNQIPGFYISGSNNNSPEPKGYKIRGGSNKNVVILLNGTPLRDVTGNDYTVADLRLIALEEIVSIEVLNGASSVLYGSNATVSVINIKTLKNADKAFQGRATLRGGSFDTFAQDLAVRGQVKDFNYSVSAFNEKSKGFSSAVGDDSFDKDGWEKQNINLNLGYSKNNFDININGGWNHNLYQYDGGAFIDSNNRGDDKQYFGGLNAAYKYNKGKVVFNSRYTTVDRNLQNFVNQGYLTQSTYKGNSFISELYNNYTVNPYFNFTVGAQFENQNMESASVPYGGNNLEEQLNRKATNINNIDVYAQANLNYQGYHLDLGARNSYNSRFKNHTVFSINPYYLGEIGNTYYKVGYSFASAFIAPSLYQSYGTLPYTVGNPDLKPETNQSHEIDLAWGTSDRNINLTASFYYRKEKDAFVYVMNPDYTGSYQNVDRNQVRGIDAGFDALILPMVKVGANYSYVYKDEVASRLRQPKTRINSFVEVNPTKTTQVSFTYLYTSKRADVFYDASFTKVDVTNAEYHIFGLNINQKILKSLGAYLNIGNLFNREYVDIVGYKTKKINFTFGVNYTF